VDQAGKIQEVCGLKRHLNREKEAERGERYTGRGGGLPATCPAHCSFSLHLAAFCLDELFAYLMTQSQGLCNHKRNIHSTFLQACV
jgi:hypothetical protein